MMSKIEKLKNLGMQRKSGAYQGYYNLAQFHKGEYETDWVSPYTKSANNVNSPMSLVLQDWASSDYLSGEIDWDAIRCGHSPKRKSNRNLKHALKEVYSLELSDVFATNLFPFIKCGDMSERIPRRDLDQAFKDFCWPQVEIVAPRLVVCLGRSVYASFVRKLNPARSIGQVGCFFEYENRVIYYQHHPSGRGVGLSQLVTEWRKMKDDVPLE
jgi:uracil-DNA glycosylase